ncbi:MAG TPA: hypothetical protein PLT68_05475, partial [Actinomycetota bacterium]|nr:hypothetical protein [Actinomycetota bacterium]
MLFLTESEQPHRDVTGDLTDNQRAVVHPIGYYPGSTRAVDACDETIPDRPLRQGLRLHRFHGVVVLAGDVFAQLYEGCELGDRFLSLAREPDVYERYETVV